MVIEQMNSENDMRRPMIYKNEQLTLFPEQPKEVELLIHGLATIEKNEELIKRAFADNQQMLWSNRREVKNRLREICIHPEIKIEYDHDYHNNVLWENHICTVCDKRLKRV